jgi:phage major head subunit gpT-like protein
MPNNINAALLGDIFAAFSARFNAGLQRGRTPPVSDASLLRYMVRFGEIAMEVPSTVGTEVHTWLAQVPGFKVWVGDRVVVALTQNGLRVTNLDREQTVMVPRNEIEDDTYGAYGNLFDAMGAEASRDAVWLDLAVDAIRNPKAWADDVAFFLSTRTYGGNTINNHLGLALTRANFKTAVSTMIAFKGAQDLPLNVTPYMLLCGSTVFWTAKNLMENQFLVEGGVQAENDVRGVCVPRFHTALDADEWYLLGMQGSYKPAAAQIRKEGTNLVRKDQPTDDNVFNAKQLVYGADLRGAGFCPFPHLVLRGYRNGTSGAPAPKASGKAKE